MQATPNPAALRQQVLAGMRAARPIVGPQSVHIDVTNGCNAACITCWDHSPLLKQARSVSWKGRRLPLERFEVLVGELADLNSVQSVILSGMGDPLTHRDIYAMIALCKARGWHVTILSNLLAGDMDQLIESGVDSILVGVHGTTPETYCAFHPGWTETHFFTLCRYLRQLTQAGVQTKHVQVINQDTAPEVPEMVRFGQMFEAQRVNFKLASLFGGTEQCSITQPQRDWLMATAIPAARKMAAELGVHTNLDLFQEQVRAAFGDIRHTTPMDEVGCFMGYVYTRITVDLDVLYCCNTKVKVGSLNEASFGELWAGERWQALRDTLRGGQFFSGCEVCGKFEQNRKWNERYGGPLHAH